MRREPKEVIDAAQALNVLNETDLGAIKKKFRKLAIEYHPDRSKHKDAAQMFKRFSEAYGVISEYHRDGGRLPVSTLVQRNSVPPVNNGGGGPIPRSHSRTTVFVGPNQNVKAWVHETYMEGGAPNFWEALNKMFDPNVFSGMSQMMGGFGRMMGDWVQGPLGTIQGRMKEVLGLMGNEKKLDADTLKDIVEIVSGGDEAGEKAIGYIEGYQNIKEGIDRVRKGLKPGGKKKKASVPQAGKAQKKKTPRKKKTKRASTKGKFRVMPLALERYKQASDGGQTPYPLWGELIPQDGSSQWGTFKVQLQGDIALIDGAKYTLECKKSS